jgi:glucose/arabinose dehydrogenase
MRSSTRFQSYLALLALVGAASAGASSCGGDDTGSQEAFDTECGTPGVSHIRMFPRLRFKLPVGMVQIPGDNSRFYVLEHGGVISLVQNVEDPANAEVFADLTDRVHLDWEAGLNGMVFHPRFAENGEVFVSYNAFVDQNARTGFIWRLSRFTSPDGGRTLDPNSEVVVLDISKENNGTNRDHNSGDLHFGPDGFLYISVGDGGAQHDPNGNARNLADLRGKVLRIDVDDRRNADIQYGVPADNPFIEGGGRPEIFAYGFRNPWRFSIDRETGDIWVGDSGQNSFEDVELVKKGQFHGWNVREGLSCHAQGPGCDNVDLGVDPVFSFGHKAANGAPPPFLASVIGGYAYRGSAIPGLQGTYIFADFVSGKVFGLYDPLGENKRPLEVDQIGKVSSFAEDQEGELYVMDYNQGFIQKLVKGPCAEKPENPGDGYKWLSQDGVIGEEAAFRYYDSIGAPRDLTLERWVQENIGAAEAIEAVYQNNADLGFWREMHCSKTIDRGVGGCWVRNWSREGGEVDATAPDRESRKDLGTVTMNVSPEGFTRFYIFAPPNENGDRVLSPTATLDSEGEKFLPNLCTPCHGGQNSGIGDLGSVFREFEPEAFVPRPGISQAEAEAEWFALNQAARTANVALASEEEGGVTGIDEGKKNMIAYMDAIFDTSTDPPTARPLDDPFHIPQSWQGGGNPVYEQAKADLWQKTINRYCETCHRANNNFDFNVFSTFEILGAESNGQAALLGFILDDPADPDRAFLPFMPQAEFLSETLRNDQEALEAVNNWVVQYTNPNTPQCQVDFIVHGADMTLVGQDVHVIGSVPELSAWEAGLGGLTLTTAAGLWPTWLGSIPLPQGALVEYKATVYDAEGNLIVWEAGNNNFFVVPEGGPDCRHTEEHVFRKF